MRYRVETIGEVLERFRREDERKRTWHRWFAWYPVTIEDGVRVWLETVERRGEWHDCPFARTFEWRWHYRLLSGEEGAHAGT